MVFTNTVFCNILPWSVLYVPIVAYDLLDESEIRTKEDEYDMSCPEDGAWIFNLAEYIREHWDRTVSFHQAHYRAVEKMRPHVTAIKSVFLDT